MIAYILSIGDELLLGQTLNTNSQYLALKLTELGFNVRKAITVRDEHIEIIAALQEAAGNADLLVATGGLGPTSDDRTKAALLDFFNADLIMNEVVLYDIKRFLEQRGRKMTNRDRQQALVPSNAEIIRNPYGTAPGLLFQKAGTIFIFMPGVPFEMQQMFEQNVIPLIKHKFDLPYVYQRLIHTLGLPEAKLAEMLQNIENEIPENISIAYLPSPEDIKIRLLAFGEDFEKVKKAVDFYADEIVQLLKDYVWGEGDTTLQQEVLKVFTEHKLTLATAESCTGGNIAHMLTLVPGASNYYKGTVVAYSNEVKVRILDVNQQDLEAYGAVSEPVVRQMAENVRKLLGTDYAVATSGIAGPTGGTKEKEKPVGTVWIAVSGPFGTYAQKFLFGPRRDVNIRRASAMALFKLLKQVRKDLKLEKN